MLKATFLLALPLLAVPVVLDDDDAKDDRKAVERAVQDYVESFYEVKPELLDRGVHPDLVKYGFWRESADKDYQGTAMTFDEAKALAAHWNKDDKQGADLKYEVELLDLEDQTAAAKLTAKWGIDYFHLAKFEGKWKIRHVIWQTIDK